MSGILYLIPTPLGKVSAEKSLPSSVISLIHELKYFAVEQVKTSIQFLQSIKHPVTEFELNFIVINKQQKDSEQDMEVLNLLLSGESVGLMSEAGCPGVADPGSQLIRLAHSAGIRVIPQVGPASMILALMASGFNGQKFRFNGYLNRDHEGRNEDLKQLEIASLQFDQTELFMESPQRNLTVLKDAITVLQNETRLLVACQITLPDEIIISKTVAEWKRTKLPDIEKKPCIFGIYGEPAFRVKPNKKQTVTKVKRW
jgi:16S rRNA (cytidine1402-2'-O)-methyltransferase